MFYHLTRQPVDVTLAMLLGKARGAGWRVLVRGTSQESMAALDEKLWLGDEAAFLPHGLEGGPHDDMQPVLLSSGTSLPKGLSCIMSVHGAEVAVDEIAASDRVCILFDGHDETALQVARGQWKALSDAGAEAEYWSEESGSWQKKAESKAAAGQG